MSGQRLLVAIAALMLLQIGSIGYLPDSWNAAASSTATDAGDGFLAGGFDNTSQLTGSIELAREWNESLGYNT